MVPAASVAAVAMVADLEVGAEVAEVLVEEEPAIEEGGEADEVMEGGEGVVAAVGEAVE